MRNIVLTLVNQCDDDHDAQVILYRSRPHGDSDVLPAWQEVEVPAHTSRELPLPGGSRYFVGVEDAGPGELHPGRADTVEVREGALIVVVSGSLATGLRVALG